jgi:phosphonate transport system substrate-binding protein
LKHEGLDLAKLKVKSLGGLVDLRGNPCSSEVHVLKTLQDGQGQAGIIGARFWNHLAKEQPDQVSGLKTLWMSPPFSHCVFTASKDFGRALADQFSKLMTAMDPNDPATAEIMRLEGTKKWLPASPEGFQELLKTLQEEAETCGSAGSGAPSTGRP